MRAAQPTTALPDGRGTAEIGTVHFHSTCVVARHHLVLTSVAYAGGHKG